MPVRTDRPLLTATLSSPSPGHYETSPEIREITRTGAIIQDSARNVREWMPKLRDLGTDYPMGRVTPPITIFEALRQDHQRQRALMNRMAHTHDDETLRAQLYLEFRHELAAHAVAEKNAFYVPLLAHDLTLDRCQHCITEHNELDSLLTALHHTDITSNRWMARARLLFDRLEQHLAEEEYEIFQLAGKALPDRQKIGLACVYADEMHNQRERVIA